VVKVQRRLERIASPAARQQIGRWVGKGFWAIMDQGLFAVSNFALNVLLARWLAPADYGAFSVAYTIFLLLGTFHTAILTEPMLVFGPGKYKERLGAYLAVLLRGHWLFGALVGALFAAAGLALWRFGHSQLTPAIFGLAIANPFILFQWLMRRACYVNLQPRLAAFAGAIYMALMAAGVFGLYHYGWLGAATALTVMAGASLVSGLWLVWQLRVDRNIEGGELAREAIGNHWRYGRWAVGTAALMWFPGNSFMLFLPSWWGLEASAVYRAMLNLLLPVMNLTTALGGLLLPSLVRLRESPTFGSTVFRLTLLFLLAPLAYWMLLGFVGEPIIQLLYGGKYSDYSHLLWLAGLVPLMAAVSNVNGAALRALELPSQVFLTYVCSTGVAVTIGLMLVRAWGVEGALVGWLLAYAVTASMMVFSFWRSRRRP